MLTYLVAFLVSMVVAAVATPLVARWAIKNSWFDLPVGGRKIHTRAIPRLGGIAVVIAFFTPLVGLAIYTNDISHLLYADALRFAALSCGGLAIVGLGIWDDLRGASPKLKLLVQTSVAIVLWSAGLRIELLGNPFGPALELGAFSLPLTVLWVVGVVNALNLIDGLDGLAAGISLFVATVLFGVAFMDHAVLLCLLTAALGGSLIGFLFFNFNPARIFLGDSGSMFLGFILAAISLWTQRKGATAVALLIPVIALGVPILDTTLSFVRRLARRQSPFTADKEHMHHRLLALGLSHRNAVFTLYTVSGVFALGALALLDNDTTHRAIVLSTVALVTFILVRKIGVLQLPGVFRSKLSSSALRDEVRVVCRSVRAAPNPEVAWRNLVQLFQHLPCEEARLSWTFGADRAGERRETAFSWRRDASTDWTLPAAPTPERLLRLVLDEEGQGYGELTLLHVAGAKRSEEQELALELARDALIDFCVTNQRAEPRSNVVRLAATDP